MVTYPANRACASCGHDPACGFASVSDENGERWLCHDDDHSCFAVPSAEAVEDFLVVVDEITDGIGGKSDG